MARRRALPRHPAHLLRLAAAVLQPLAPALAPAAAAALILLPGQATAQAPAAARHSYQIPAGTLDQALNRFAGTAGVELSVDAALTRGKTSPGLQGSYTVDEALARLLAGQDLRVVQGANGAYSLRPAPPPPPAAAPAAGGAATPVLDTVTVTAAAERSATSEGTGSYAARGATLFKGVQSLREIPQSVSVVTRRQMDDQNMTTIDEAVMQAAGVGQYGNASAAGVASYYARGYPMEAQYDGLPARSGFTNPQFDLSIYDRIEVLRGPAGLLQGSGNLGGTINMVRKRPQAETAVRYGLSAGSWNNFHADIDATGALSADGRVRGRAVLAARDADAFYDRGKTRQFTGYGIVEVDLTPATTLGVSLAAQRADLRSFSGFSTYLDGRFLPLPRSANLDAPWNGRVLELQEAVADLTHVFDNGWEARAALRHSRTRNYRQEGIPRSGVDPATLRGSYMFGRYDNDYANTGANLQLSGPFELFGRRHHAVVGYSHDRHLDEGGFATTMLANQFYLAPLLPEYALPPITATTATLTEQSGWYGMARLKLLEPLTLVLGGRFTDFSTHTRNLTPNPSAWQEGRNRTRGRFSPYGGLIWDIDRRVSAYASYADIFIPQTQVDYFGETLKPRVGWQGEVGFKGELLDGRLNASIAYYRMEDENRAINDPDPTHIGCGGGATSVCQIAGGLVRSQGWEVEVTGSPAPGWELSASYVHGRSRFVKDSNALNAGLSQWTYSPDRIFKLWTNYRFAEGSTLAGWNIGGGLHVQSAIHTNISYNASGHNTVRQGGYALAALQVGYRFSPKMQATLTVNNLFDRVYYKQINDPRSFNYYGEPRSVTVALRGTF